MCDFKKFFASFKKSNPTMETNFEEIVADIQEQLAGLPEEL